MLEFFIYNICVMLGESRHSYWYHLSSLCFVSLFVLDRIHKGGSGNKLTRSFNFTFLYRDDVQSLNNCNFGDIVDCVWPIELVLFHFQITVKTKWRMSWPRHIVMESWVLNRYTKWRGTFYLYFQMFEPFCATFSRTICIFQLRK